MRPCVALALDVAAILLDLRRGRALDAAGRARVIDALARCLPALAGRPVPGRAISDPALVIEAAVVLARDAGMDGPAMVEAFNDASERYP